MGSPTSEADRRYHERQHIVVLTKDFQISATEVTIEHWESVMGTSEVDICEGSELPARAEDKTTPMRCVSWCDAVLFLNTLSEKNDLNPVYSFSVPFSPKSDTNLCNSEAVYTTWNPLSNGYRLPTESEWEYAARTSFSGPYAGAAEINSVAWWNGNSREPQPVGRLDKNGWGLYDMSGNVWEWTWDHYDLYLPGKSIDPKGPVEDINQDGRKVVRGGSFRMNQGMQRVSNRGIVSPGLRSAELGFRYVRSKQ